MITHVETTLAAVNDADMAAPIQNALIAKGLAPGDHYLDAGYVDAQFVVDSQLHQQVEVVGPVRPDVSWQARAGQGYDQGHFSVDWAGHTVTCPQGRTSQTWTEHLDTWGNAVIEVQFSRTHCRQCPARALCTKAVGSPRGLTLRHQAEYEVLQEARRRQMTPEWAERYHRRAGIEGSLLQGVRAYELRQSRYIGLAQTHLQHLLLVAAINLVRLVAWWDERAPAPTRVSRFGALAPAAT